MGLFNKIISLFSGSETTNERDNTLLAKSANSSNITTVKELENGMTKLEEKKCPYCNYEFEKPLSRKKKCPDCGQDIYVRTLPFHDGVDKVRVAVTEKHADRLDIAWAKQNGTYKELMKSIKERDAKKKELKKAWGKEPNESDVEWHSLMDQRIQHAKNNQWGLYRNTTLRMAEHLYKQKKYENSLRIYLEVLYIDLNGPQNGTIINGKYPKGEYKKAFTPPSPTQFFASSIVDRIVLLKNKRIPMSDQQVKKLFLEQGQQIHKPLALPLPPEQAWSNWNQNADYWGEKE